MLTGQTGLSRAERAGWSGPVHPIGRPRAIGAFECARNRVVLPELNVPLLEKVMSHIESHPDEHNQTFWARKQAPECGTTYCFAGWAVAMTLPDDARPVWSFDTHGTAGRWLVPTGGGRVQSVDIPSRATVVLGLTHLEARKLFDARNSVEQLRQAVDALMAAEQIRLANQRTAPDRRPD